MLKYATAAILGSILFDGSVAMGLLTTCTHVKD